MPIIVVCNVFQERLAFYGKCPFIVVCNVFQERMAFYGKCLLSSFVMCFKSIWLFTGIAYNRRLQCVSRACGILMEMPTIVVCNVSQKRLAFYGSCQIASFVMCFKSVWHFREMPNIVVCNVFQERMAFYGKCLLSLFRMCFNREWHFTGNAYYRRL